MRADLPSLTAMFVAFARGAVTTERGAAGEGLDPFARELLPAPARAVLDAVAFAERATPLAMRAVRAASLGVVDHCELRSLAIDEAVRGAIDAGASQLVVVGAGLDARAMRLRELSRVTVFEVDHPATQRWKRAHAPDSPARFVAVDFERDALGDELARAGHDSRSPTAWIWEGVTMYLVPEATRATIATIAARSAGGSTLAVTYLPRAMMNLGESMKPLVHRVFGVLGEPLRAVYEPREMAATLDEAGFDVKSDSGVEDWAARFGAREPRWKLAERLAVAVKRGARR